MGLTSPTTRWTRSTLIASQRLKMVRGRAGPEEERRREMESPLRGTTIKKRRWRPSARLRTGTQKSRSVFDIPTQDVVFLVAELYVVLCQGKFLKFKHMEFSLFGSQVLCFRFAHLLSVQGGPGLLFRLKRFRRERRGVISSEHHPQRHHHFLYHHEYQR